MLHSTTLTDFNKNISETLERTVKYNEPTCISTQSGNVVLLSEKEYNRIMETLYLISVPGMQKRLEEGSRASVKDCVDFEW